MHSSSHGYPGVFITFEGGEGVGKTTQIRFLQRILKRANLEVLSLREPGGTKIGEAIRRVVLDTRNASLDDRGELLLYAAARAQIVREVIQPALVRGAVVLCDRFCDSTMAYQGYGRGLDKDFIRQVNDFVCQDIMPDKTILLQLDSTSKGLHRATRRLGADRLELAGEDFHQRVNEGFKKIAAQTPDRIASISSADTKSETARAIWAELEGVFTQAFAIEPPSERDFANLDRTRRSSGTVRTDVQHSKGGSTRKQGRSQTQRVHRKPARATNPQVKQGSVRDFPDGQSVRDRRATRGIRNVRNTQNIHDKNPHNAQLNQSASSRNNRINQSKQAKSIRTVQSNKSKGMRNSSQHKGQKQAVSGVLQISEKPCSGVHHE